VVISGFLDGFCHCYVVDVLVCQTAWSQHGASDVERQPRRVSSTAILDRRTDDRRAYLQCPPGSTIRQRIPTASVEYSEIGRKSDSIDLGG